jgi:integrase
MRNTVSVTPYKHPRYTHRVRFPGPNGKRIDRFFSNLTQAEAFAKEQRKETGEVGTAFGSLAESERSAIEFWRAFVASASPPPPSALSVLQEFAVKWKAAKASLNVSIAVDQFVEHQQAEGSSERHVATLKSRLGRFSSDLGHRIVSSITTSDFTFWLNSLRATRSDKKGEKLTLVTRTNLSRSLRTFFAFCLDQGWTLENPVPAVKRAKNKAAKLAVKKQPGVLSPTAVAEFMEAVQKTYAPLIPFWAVKFFAGIRDAEAARMDWNMVDLAAGEIHLPSSITKTGEPRTVKIESNLAAWLQPHAKEAGPLAAPPMTRRYHHKKILKALEKKDETGKVTAFVFPNNAARHSFGTYHLFQFRNAGETALQLGHKGNPAMLHEHYKNPSAEKQAAAFWNVLPSNSPDNVIRLSPPSKSSTRKLR